MQEAVAVPPHVAFAIRPNPGCWEFVKVNSEDLKVEPITVTEFLKFKELVSDENWYVLFCPLCNWFFNRIIIFSFIN